MPDTKTPTPAETLEQLIKDKNITNLYDLEQSYKYALLKADNHNFKPDRSLLIDTIRQVQVDKIIENSKSYKALNKTISEVKANLASKVKKYQELEKEDSSNTNNAYNAFFPHLTPLGMHLPTLPYEQNYLDDFALLEKEEHAHFFHPQHGKLLNDEDINDALTKLKTINENIYYPKNVPLDRVNELNKYKEENKRFLNSRTEIKDDEIEEENKRFLNSRTEIKDDEIEWASRKYSHYLGNSAALSVDFDHKKAVDGIIKARHQETGKISDTILNQLLNATVDVDGETIYQNNVAGVRNKPKQQVLKGVLALGVILVAVAMLISTPLIALAMGITILLSATHLKAYIYKDSSKYENAKFKYAISDKSSDKLTKYFEKYNGSTRDAHEDLTKGFVDSFKPYIKDTVLSRKFLPHIPKIVATALLASLTLSLSLFGLASAPVLLALAVVAIGFVIVVDHINPSEAKQLTTEIDKFSNIFRDSSNFASSNPDDINHLIEHLETTTTDFYPLVLKHNIKLLIPKLKSLLSDPNPTGNVITDDELSQLGTLLLSTKKMAEESRDKTEKYASQTHSLIQKIMAEYQKKVPQSSLAQIFKLSLPIIPTTSQPIIN